jgi:hypothetical protein
MHTPVIILNLKNTLALFESFKSFKRYISQRALFFLGIHSAGWGMQCGA